MNEKCYWVYVLASARNGMLYVGVTSDLSRRIWEHQQGVVEGFTKKYHVHRLVYYETHASIDDALRREKSIKRWSRNRKRDMIETMNPEWEDLYAALNQ